MHIIWRGLSCFQLTAQNRKNGQTTIAIDPFEQEGGLSVHGLKADILLTSREAGSYLKAVKPEPFLIDSPGEYEIKDIFIQGISGEDKQGKIITIYVIEIEGIKFCHLSIIGQKELKEEQMEKIGNCDVLMIPIGGGEAIDGTEAARLANQIRPKIVIPMYYKIPKLKMKLDGKENFLKALGQKSVETMSKLSLKERDLPKEEGEMRVVVLEP